MSQLFKYFLRGCLFVVPIAVTVWVILKVLAAIDSLVVLPEQWLGVRVPGLGLIIVLLVVSAAGYLASHFFTRRWATAIDGRMQRLPLVKLIYGSIKDLLGAFVGDKASFEAPVLLSLAEDGSIGVLGFVTRQDLAALGMPGRVAVYVPQSYNFAANLFIVPRERVREVPVPSAEVMTFIVSGGLSGLAAEVRPAPP